MRTALYSSATPRSSRRVSCTSGSLVLLTGSSTGSPYLLRPGVTVRGVIHYKVHDDADAALLAFAHQPVEVGECSVLRIDVLVIRDVVAEIDLGRGITRSNPNCIDAELFQIVQFRGDSIDIA